MSAVEHDAEHLCRIAYARYSQGDVEGLLELFHPEVEVHVAPPNFESGVYRGHDEYRKLMQRWGAAWDEMRIEPRDMEVAGDWVLAFVDYIGCGKGSGVEVTQPSWELSLWQDGFCRRYFVYWDEEDGCRAFAEHAEVPPRRIELRFG